MTKRMPRPAALHWAVSSILLGCSPGTDYTNAPCGSFASDLSTTAPEATDERQRRDRQIIGELGGIGAHDWAGSYFYGDGLGVNVSLNLAPTSGFTLTERGCLGLYVEDYGSVKEQGQRLVLSSELPPTTRSRSFSTELNVVNWGHDIYLVPTQDLLRFVNGVNSGSLSNGFLRRDGLLALSEDAPRTAGKPDLPPPWKGLLLDHPLSATVVSIGNGRPYMISGTNFGQRVTVTLDQGSDAGIFDGMELHLSKPKLRLSTDATITSVEKTTSTAVVTCWTSTGRPNIGWNFSSRHWRSDNDGAQK